MLGTLLGVGRNRSESTDLVSALLELPAIREINKPRRLKCGYTSGKADDEQSLVKGVGDKESGGKRKIQAEGTVCCPQRVGAKCQTCPCLCGVEKGHLGSKHCVLGASHILPCLILQAILKGWHYFPTSNWWTWAPKTEGIYDQAALGFDRRPEYSQRPSSLLQARLPLRGVWGDEARQSKNQRPVSLTVQSRVRGPGPKLRTSA